MVTWGTFQVLFMLTRVFSSCSSLLQQSIHGWLFVDYELTSGLRVSMHDCLVGLYIGTVKVVCLFRGNMPNTHLH